MTGIDSPAVDVIVFYTFRMTNLYVMFRLIFIYFHLKVLVQNFKAIYEDFLPVILSLLPPFNLFRAKKKITCLDEFLSNKNKLLIKWHVSSFFIYIDTILELTTSL